MTQYEMIEKLSEKCNVTEEEARAALEAGDWNMLTATQLLDQEKFRRKQALDEVAASCAAAVQAAPDDADAGEATAEAAEAAEAIEADAPAKAKKRGHGQGLRKLGYAIRGLVIRGNRNRFVIRKRGETVLELPVTVLVLALLCAFWFCLPLLVIGLFTGFHYSFSGEDLGRKSINNTLDKASSVAEHVKKTVVEA